MKKEHKRDIGWGIFFLLFAGFVWLVVPHQIPVPARPSAMGPRFFPRVISLILAIVSLGLVLSTLLKHKRDMKENQDEEITGNENGETKLWKSFFQFNFNKDLLNSELRALLVFLVMIIYTVLMPVIGFVISSTMAGIAILIILGEGKWYYYPIIFVIVYVIYYVFRFYLYVQLP